MNRSLCMFNLAPSPNSIKVRLALGFKQLACEKIDINPEDRSPIIKASGQPLAPVLLHGDTVVFESHAILRYLDGNFRDTPRLFSKDRDIMRGIEAWEIWERQDPSNAVGACIGEAFKPEPDLDAVRKAAALLNRAADRVEAVLADSPFLVGGTLTAADITIAPWMACGLLTAEAAETFPPIRLLIDQFRLEGHEKTCEWVTRIMAYDR
ncbi:MAG: glutathione S-transferase family protein [Acidobacteriota bacterium]